MYTYIYTQTHITLIGKVVPIWGRNHRPRWPQHALLSHPSRQGLLHPTASERRRNAQDFAHSGPATTGLPQDALGKRSTRGAEVGDFTVTKYRQKAEEIHHWVCFLAEEI